MCGIVGFTGKAAPEATEKCREILLSGLENLEYRGYDSAGIAMAGEGEGITICRAVGRISNLRKAVAGCQPQGSCGIGHTRWATHGRPTVENCHPHEDEKHSVAVVHNGIIENYQHLKEELQRSGVEFNSQTDTEVIAQLLAHHYSGNMKDTLQKVLPLLEGSFALGVLDKNQPDCIYCARRRSPLLVAQGKDGSYLASDVSALLAYTKDVTYLEENGIAVLTPDSIRFYNENGSEIHPESTHITWDATAARKNGFEHYMLKEIFDQPTALRDTLNHYVDVELGCIRREAMPFTPEQAKALRRVTIAACGTAYHASVMGQSLLEQLAGIPALAAIASEYRYSNMPPVEGEVFIAVSQSGETADTLAALSYKKAQGLRTIALSNVLGSTIAREADAVMYTLAGPEIAVASTKAYLTQVLLFAILALDLAHLRGVIDDAKLKEGIAALAKLPEQVEEILAKQSVVQDFVQQQKDCRDIFFIGRLMDYASSLEAALKLKEVSYLHSEAYAAGELKHGTIALVDESCLVVVFATQTVVLEKTLANMEEVRARGAKLLLLGHFPEGAPEDCSLWNIGKTSDQLAPLLTTVYAQLFAYYMAKLHGCDIDKPRNLAKSVTVE
ncbi:MAG: glutamine--fructose-6-phosphate transaminase (isomerizing) [Oscillospiraceae bacterium]|nr:glutamine--fructose-6-phosphate transaminase (isomerizing) [Oscillospiraceae bacterium]